MISHERQNSIKFPFKRYQKLRELLHKSVWIDHEKQAQIARSSSFQSVKREPLKSYEIADECSLSADNFDMNK
jgi:hypothetical protein